jgi:para-nitrobenzyl esterase
MDFAKVLGAAHGFEIPFVFNRFVHLGDADRVLFEERSAEEREQLSRTMGGYWASFARDGVPSSPSAPAWPAYAENHGSFMRFDTEDDGGVEVVVRADDLLTITADLQKDPRLDDANRCLIVGEMNEWMFTRPLHTQLRAATGCP